MEATRATGTTARTISIQPTLEVDRSLEDQAQTPACARLRPPALYAFFTAGGRCCFRRPSEHFWCGAGASQAPQRPEPPCPLLSTVIRFFRLINAINAKQHLSKTPINSVRCCSFSAGCCLLVHCTTARSILLFPQLHPRQGCHHLPLHHISPTLPAAIGATALLATHIPPPAGLIDFSASLTLHIFRWALSTRASLLSISPCRPSPTGLSKRASRGRRFHIPRSLHQKSRWLPNRPSPLPWANAGGALQPRSNRPTSTSPISKTPSTA